MSDSTTNSGSPLEPTALVAVFDQFAGLDRYSHQRDEILEQLLGVTYLCEVEFGSSERTYGYTPDDRFRDGRTVIGLLKGSAHKVALQMPADQNDRVEGLASGATLQQAAVFMSWSSIYDRFELLADLATAVVKDDASEQQVASPVAPPSPASEPVAPETVADETVSPEPSVSEPSPTPAAPVEEPAEDSVSESYSPVATPEPVATVPELSRLSAEDRNAFLDAEQPLTSASLIDFLATGLQLRVEQVTAVVDGFWDYVLQPEHFGRQKKVIPNFGTFSLDTQGGQPALVFQSKSSRQLLAQQSKGWNHVASDRWIRYYQAKSDPGDISGLSVKRRMSVWIAERTEESLAIVHRVLWELMSLVCDLMAEGKRSIRWAMRGVMFPREVQLKGEDQPQKRYAFRTYGRLAKKLVSPVAQPARKSMLGNYFKGPGTLQRSTVVGSRNWFSLRWWGVPLLFVLSLNLASWPNSRAVDFSLQFLIGATTFGMPLALSVVFFVLGGMLLALTDQRTDRLPLWTFRFFMVMSVMIGLLGFVLAVAFRCLDVLVGL